MTQEEKDFLLKDICARLPYGVKIALKNNGGYHHENIAKKGDVTIDELKGFSGTYFSIFHNNPNDWDWYDDNIDVEDIKPYLFPLSSMTEEQCEKFIIISGWDVDIEDVRRGKFSCIGYVGLDYMYDAIDWFNKNHFDYRGLIEKSLALDATNLGIYE